MSKWEVGNGRETAAHSIYRDGVRVGRGNTNELAADTVKALNGYDEAMAIVRELAEFELVHQTGKIDGKKCYACEFCGDRRTGYGIDDHHGDCIYPVWKRARKLVEAAK